MQGDSNNVSPLALGYKGKKEERKESIELTTAGQLF
jgi:hypothetical protein